MTPEQFDKLYNLRQELFAYETAIKRVDEMKPPELTSFIGMRIDAPAQIHDDYKLKLKNWLKNVLAEKTRAFEAVKV
jgi:hypothetical protein